MPERIAIIAAMEREVRPLVRSWRGVRVDGLRGWHCGNVLVVCGGIGGRAAQKAAESAVRVFAPQVLISAGFAGSLDGACRAPELFLPAKVIDARSGKEYCSGDGNANGTLLTVDAIADAACKQELARRFAAQAVDMEAAAVAEVARERGLEFWAVKAISEDAGFPLPPLGRFLREDGGFYTLAFVAHVLARPRLWRAVGELHRNTGLAAAALRGGLRPLEAGWAPLGETRQRRGGAG